MKDRLGCDPEGPRTFRAEEIIGLLQPGNSNIIGSSVTRKCRLAAVATCYDSSSEVSR